MANFLTRRFPLVPNSLVAAALMGSAWLVGPAYSQEREQPPPPPRGGPRGPGGPPPWVRPGGPGGPGFPNFEAIERLNSLPPAQRERFLNRLPPERRRMMEERMERFRSMAPEEKQKLRERMAQFEQMDPEEQERARRAFRRFSLMPEDRREALQGEMDTLRRLGPEERRRYVRTPQFRDKFLPPERRLVLEMMGLFEPGPMQRPRNPDDHD